MLRFLDISGFGHSGKSAFTDLVREFDGYWVPHALFEFDLLRVQGGVLDLKHALEEDWSLIRSSAAVDRFREVARRMGTVARVSSPSSLFVAYGTNYESYFRGRFFELTQAYIDSLVLGERRLEVPYPALDLPTLQVFGERLLRQLGRKAVPARRVSFVPVENGFHEKTADYLEKLFSVVVGPGDRVAVLNNSLEPFNPVRGIELFRDARCLAISRDPRDIYASIVAQEGYVPEFERRKGMWALKTGFLGGNDVDLFIERQRLLSEAPRKFRTSARVLRLRYERLVLDYHATVDELLAFLGEPASVHARPGTIFDPSLSAKNVGIWKRLDDQAAIRKIEAALPDLCYE